MTRKRDKAFFIGNTLIQRVGVSKNVEPVLRCTICNVKIQVRSFQHIKSIEVLRELIREDIPNFRESADSIELCGQCHQDILDYHRLCVTVQETRIRLLDAINKSQQIREEELVSRAKQSTTTEMNDESQSSAEYGKKTHEVFTRRALIDSAKRKDNDDSDRSAAESASETDLDEVPTFSELEDDEDFYWSEDDTKQDDDSQGGDGWETSTNSKSKIQGTTKGKCQWPCPKEGCDQIFDYKKSLDNHVTLFHGGYAVKILRCPECPKICKTALSLEIHSQVHQGIPELECTVCGKICRNTASLIQHRNAHANNAKHICDICGRVYRLAGSLKKHRLTHTHTKPFACDQCGKRYWTAYLLKEHTIFRHKGEKKWQCDQCDRRYVTKSSMDLHIEVVHKKLPPRSAVYCHLCDNLMFDRQHLLRKHMMKVHNTILSGDSFKYPKADHVEECLEEEIEAVEYLEEQAKAETGEIIEISYS